METVLYEYHFDFDNLLSNLIPVIVGIGFILAARAISKTDSNIRGKGAKGFRVLCMVVASLSIVVGVLCTLFMLLEHDQLKKRLENDDVFVVEGYVENYHPMPATGHDMEHFEINGVYFEYSDFDGANGYHNAASLGGVVTRNGQYLKIKYVVSEDDEGTNNRILYIADLTPND